MSALLDRDPGNPDLFLKRGELHRANGDLAAAIADFERARALRPAQVDLDLRIGGALLELGRPASARHILDRFLSAWPDHSGALAARGRTLMKMGRCLEAAGDFTRAIRAHGASPAPQPDLYLARSAALAASSRDRLPEALRGLDEGIDRLGPAVSLQLAAIDLELRLSRHDAALARLETAAARSQRKERWLARRGESLAMAGRSDEARRAFESALEAIAALSERHRSSQAIAALESNVRDALARLPVRAAGMEPGR